MSGKKVRIKIKPLFYSEESVKKIEAKYGKICGQKRCDSTIYQHGGNWAYLPAVFYSVDVCNAIATAVDLDTDLYVWDEKKKEFCVVFEAEWLYERNSDELAAELVADGLKGAGAEEKDLRGGRVIRSACRPRE